MVHINSNCLPDEVRKAIPVGEMIRWCGRPNWKSLGYHAFGVKYLTVYLILSALYAVSQTNSPFRFGAFTVQYLPYIMSGIFASIILFVLAYLAARHTCYVITEKRVVIRTGIALVFLLNVPFKNVVSIDLQRLANGSGNLSFKAQSKKRIPYLSCWPSVRSGSLLQPVPAFRSILSIEEIGKICGELAEYHRVEREKNGESLNSGAAA